MRKGKVSLSELIKINKENLLKDKQQLEKIDKRVEDRLYESQRNKS